MLLLDDRLARLDSIAEDFDQALAEDPIEIAGSCSLRLRGRESGEAVEFLLEEARDLRDVWATVQFLTPFSRSMRFSSLSICVCTSIVSPHPQMRDSPLSWKQQMKTCHPYRSAQK